MARDNGPLYVVPGSHRNGYLKHYDTPSHLGLPQEQFNFDNALAIDGAVEGGWGKGRPVRCHAGGLSD